MKKVIIFAALAAAVLASCAKNEVFQKETTQTPVTFGVYVPQTKAGAAGQTTTATIQRSEVSGGGFGVFAYYTDDQNYAAAVSAGTNKPNFMYNQGVFWNSTAWQYSPVKYWPNEYGASAHSAATDYVSFFAYAPFVSNTGFETPGSYNITAKAPANNAAGDPKITYVIDPTPSTAVDLCWAVNDATGLPWKDQTKQTITGTIPFKFKHALARFNVNVRGFFDEVRPSQGAVSTADIDENTKITIEKIEITGSFYPSGVLNLNNTAANTALWETPDAASTTLTIPNADIHSSLKATVDGETTFPTSITGVTKTNVNVFTGAAPAKTDATYYTFIPKASNTTLNVKITYYVTTQDANLEGSISCVKNVIDKSINFASFACGLNYNLNIVLGMTTVKLEATVEDWADPSNVDIDLPVNTAA